MRFDHCDTIRFNEPKAYRMHLGKSQARCAWRADANPDGERCEATFWKKSPNHVCCFIHGQRWRVLPAATKDLLRLKARTEDAKG